jgi:hypothetical protein
VDAQRAARRSALGRGSTARAEIAFAASMPGRVYASVDNNKGEVWRSDDSGATWQFQSTPLHLNNQGDYDNAIWVDPTDASHVIVAGLDIYQSRDGGFVFDKVSDWRNTPQSPHADHHALVSPPDFRAGNRRLFNGNDGGIYRAANVDALAAGASGFGWTNANSGSRSRSSTAGRDAPRRWPHHRRTQDNGSLQLNQGQWVPFRGGDGGYVAVDPASDLTFYGSYVYLSIHRSTTGGFASYICAGSPRRFRARATRRTAARAPPRRRTSSRPSSSTPTTRAACSRAPTRSGSPTTPRPARRHGAWRRRPRPRPTNSSTRSRCTRATPTSSGWGTTTARSTAP